MILSIMTPPPLGVSRLWVDLDGSQLERGWGELAQTLKISVEALRAILNRGITDMASRLAPSFAGQEQHCRPLFNLILIILPGLPESGSREGMLVRGMVLPTSPLSQSKRGYQNAG
jgi:hypothetical protein